MYAVFVKLLNMSVAASIPIAVVFCLRLLLRKTPKKYICLLWAIAALRLCCPVSISSAVSAYNYIGTPRQTDGQMAYVQYNGKAEQPMGELPVFTVADIAMDAEAAQEGGKNFYLPTAMGIWAAGFAGMLGYAAMSFLRLRRQTQEAVRFSGNIYRCDHLPSPFILGIVRPKIYLPSDLKEPQRQSVIAHEQAHIRRLDHWWKPLGYLILSVHWFNPLVWLGYALLSRDIETACDERVIEKMNSKQKQEYSETLLQCSMPQKFISACPLAFGETGVKQRIKGILNYRRPTAWLVVVSLLICMCAAAAFLTDPVQAETAAANYGIQYKLQIGAENVSYISIDYPGGRGRCAKADGSVFQLGESIDLELLNDVADVSGVTLRAYTEGEELVWERMIPENTKNVHALYDEGWGLQKFTTQPRTGDEYVLFFSPTTIRHEAMTFTVPEQCRFYCLANNMGGGSFLVDDQPVGGVANYPLDSEQMASGMDWVSKLDFPEWKLDNVGYMADGPIGGPYTVEVFNEAAPVAEDAVRNIHHLFYQSGRIYDLWFDELRAPQKIQDALLTSVTLAGMTQPGVIYSSDAEATVYSTPGEHSDRVGALLPEEQFNVELVELFQQTLWGFGTSRDQNLRGWVKMDDLPQMEAAGEDTLLEEFVNEYENTGVVMTGGDTALNVRSGPGAQYSIVSNLNAGDTLHILETVTSEGIEWGRIGTDQWVCMEYITVNDAADLQETSVNEYENTGVVMTGGDTALNVRSGPGAQYSVVSNLKAGDTLHILETVTSEGVEWGRIGTDQWVCMEYITVNDAADLQETSVAENGAVLRSSPSHQGREMGILSPGTRVIIERSENVANVQWSYVHFGNVIGWVEAKNLTASAPTEGGHVDRAINSASSGDGTVLYLYSAPSLNARICGELESDAQITIQREEKIANTPWCYVSSGDLIGWIMAESLPAA